MNKKLQTGYCVNSFDRFGDDLCEELIKYLSFKDKIRFECVSTQWKRTIFQRQYVLDIQTKTNPNMMNALPAIKLLSYYFDADLFNVSIIERVLSKCPQINRIIIGENIITTSDAYDELIRLIADNCKRLTSIEFNDQRFAIISENALNYFSEKCGKSLKTIINESYGFRLKSLLSSCPNLSIISNVYLNDLIDDKSNNILAPNLSEVRGLIDCEESCGLMTEFVERYSTIKVLNIRYNYKDSNKFMSLISQLVCLTNLSIIMSGIQISQFAANLKKVAFSCDRIKKLSINLCQCTGSYFLLLNSINDFGSLKYLHLSIPEAGIVPENNDQLSVKLLSKCFHLTHLSIRASIGNKFFADIHLYLPQLKVINIETLRRISDKAMNYFSKLTDLRAIKVVITMRKNAKISDTGVCNVLENCSKFNSLTLRPGLNVTAKTINAFNEKAMISEKINFTLNLLRCDANVRETIRCALNNNCLSPNFKIPIPYNLTLTGFNVPYMCVNI